MPRANVLTRRANVPYSVPKSHFLRNAKGNFYTLLLFKKFYILLDIIVLNIICSYMYRK